MRRFLYLIYVVLALAALTLIPLSAIGVIQKDPLSALPAMLLGMPWSMIGIWLSDRLLGEHEGLGALALLALSLFINAMILKRFARPRRRRRTNREYPEPAPETDLPPRE
jgi:hypothetical protein